MIFAKSKIRDEDWVSFLKYRKLLWRKNHRAKLTKEQRKYVRAKKYNLNAIEYLTLEREHNNLCAICNQPETTSNQHGPVPLSIDHDHKTGKVRGLLCARCNHLLGRAQDSIEILNSAIKYLEKYSK